MVPDVDATVSLASNCCNWLVPCLVPTEPLLLQVAVAELVDVDGEDVAGYGGGGAVGVCCCCCGGGAYWIQDEARGDASSELPPLPVPDVAVDVEAVACVELLVWWFSV